MHTVDTSKRGRRLYTQVYSDVAPKRLSARSAGDRVIAARYVEALLLGEQRARRRSLIAAFGWGVPWGRLAALLVEEADRVEDGLLDDSLQAVGMVRR